MKQKHLQPSKEVVDIDMRKVVKKAGRPKKMDKPEEIQPFKTYSVAEIMAMPLDEDISEDQIFDNILILRGCPNPDFVVGRLDGFAINICCGRKLSNRLIGKQISIKKPKDEEIYYYLP
jgi:hypothetical protein